MAAKKRDKRHQKTNKQVQLRPAERLREAELAFQRGDLAAAYTLASTVLPAIANDPPTQQRAYNLLTEICLQKLPEAASVTQRLELLNGAIHRAPKQPRLHFRRALEYWHGGDISAALQDLRLVAGIEPQWPGLRFLLQLGELVEGRPWQATELTPAETNTLQLLHDVQRDNDAPRLLKTLADKPLIGDAAVWRQLLQMHSNTKAAPVGLLAPVVSSEAVAFLPAVVRYYRGVAAMRADDGAAAYAAWKSAAADIATPWLHANLDAYVRNQGTRLAETGAWQEIVDLFESIPRRFGQREPDAALSELVGLAYFNLGFTAAQAGQWTNAVVHFRAADNLIKSRQLSQNLALAEEAAEDWISAAEAWRETLRRRPRKADHPDALSDAQVATIWLRAAHCYDQAGNKGEVITCIKSAVKYAPDNLALRIGLVDMMLNDERAEAAGNELERILDEHPDHIPALTRMATLYMSQWGGDALPLWRRVLKLEPGNIDARHAMTIIYMERAADPDVYVRFYGRRPTTAKKIELLEKGLSELPNSPELLMTMGVAYLEDRKEGKARQAMETAARYAAGNLPVLNGLLHELLHVKGEATVRELIPQVRAIAGLRPGFWTEQAERVLECKLGDQWFETFANEAIVLSANKRGPDSPAATLLAVFEICFDNDAGKLAQKYEQMLRSQWPASGAVEFIDALHALNRQNPTNTRSLKLLDRAIVQAGKAGETGIVEMAQELKEDIKFPLLPDGFDIGRLMDMFANMNEEDFNAAFRRRF